MSLVKSIAIFADVQNIYYTTRQAYDRQFNYRKFWQRISAEGKIISANAYAIDRKVLENIEIRASSAYFEFKDAHNFQYVLPNHDGEDSENWDAFYYPLGDARKALYAFASLLDGKISEILEHWETNLIT